MVRALLPEAEIISRPRFSTLSHAGARKLSRIPPRSAIVAFSAEQVYAIAEMLRRFRGGAAVVMGALSPQTRNAQVALYQSGEVDYLVATDAIGMGLNLDVDHVAFAGLSKFDGVRQRRLTPAEMAQIAGRAGRHQRDGTFGTLAGTGGSHDANSPTRKSTRSRSIASAAHPKLYWREARTALRQSGDADRRPRAPPLPEGSRPRPRRSTLPCSSGWPRIRRSPPTHTTPGIGRAVLGSLLAARFPPAWGGTHARFVARLWQDLRHGELGADYVARPSPSSTMSSGDIDTLQGRIAAIRSWAYIAQRPDWVRARDEMAARARAVEARLSDALHARLTERFVNRRTAVLMKKLGPDEGLLPVALEGDEVLVDGELIGSFEGLPLRGRSARPPRRPQAAARRRRTPCPGPAGAARHPDSQGGATDRWRQIDLAQCANGAAGSWQKRSAARHRTRSGARRPTRTGTARTRRRARKLAGGQACTTR
jgi:ATP-dependent RNA helicase SUPV3L1/SUV3